MKKKIALLVVLSMLLGGVVSYASLYGTFEGNPIVRVQSNGQTIAVEDVPAINLNGRTMVPIYMLRDLGANVSWDGATETVSVLIPHASVDDIDEVDIEILKRRALIADIYKFLEDVGENIYRIDNSFSIGLNGMRLIPEQSDYLYRVTYDRIVEQRDKLLVVTDLYEQWSVLYPHDIQYIDKIIENYVTALEHYDKAYISITDFFNGNNQNGYNSHFDDRTNASKLIFSSFDITGSRYDLMINSIANY